MTTNHETPEHQHNFTTMKYGPAYDLCGIAIEVDVCKKCNRTREFIEREERKA